MNGEEHHSGREARRPRSPIAPARPVTSRGVPCDERRSLPRTHHALSLPARIDGDHPVECRRVELREWLRRVNDAGVVERAVEPAELFDRCRDELHVAFDGWRSPPPQLVRCQSRLP
jgi:hypothetical protein